MPDVFISYARATADVAQTIARALRGDGYDVWIDDALPLHREFASVIEENLRASKAVLVLWSPEARASRWVPAEADVAHERGTLVQLSLDGAPPPFPFNRQHCELAAGWRGDPSAVAWRKVLDSIAVLTRRERPATDAADAEPAVLSPARGAGPLLAVLAFDNLSGDAELTDFCDGVSEEIQQTVAQGAALKVVARSSSFQFRGPDKAVAKVAAALGVSHVLDGSVRRSGQRVRISAQLIDCAGGGALWSNRFDGDLTDVFDLQDRIAQAVAQALKVTLVASPQAETLDPATYELFIRARGLITEGSRLYDEIAPEATPLLEQVVDNAPDHAAAWELLALSRALALRSPRREAPYGEAKDLVVAAAETALRLDPKRGSAHVALSMLEPWGAYATRERLLEQALEVAPNDPGALTEMSTFCWSVGRFRDALSFAQHASEINPLMPSALLLVAEMRLYVGDYEGSIRMHQELRRRWPRNAPILISLLGFSAGRGFWDAYDEAFGHVGEFDGDAVRFMRANHKYAQAMRHPDAAFRAERLGRYTAAFDQAGMLPLNVIEAIGNYGFTDEAFDLAMRGDYKLFDPEGLPPSGSFPGVILGPWSALNKDERFIPLCEKLGLNAYWRQTERWPDCSLWTPYDFKAAVRRGLPVRAASTPIGV